MRPARHKSGPNPFSPLDSLMRRSKGRGMHEAGIAEAALEQAAEQARRAGATRIHRIVLRVGTLSGVEAGALEFALQLLLPGGPAEGAEVEIESVPALARCSSCSLDYTPEGGLLFECPRCGALGAALLRGRELELARLELS